MRLKYSIKALLVLTAMVAVVTFLQVQLNRTIASFQNDICDPDSPLHSTATDGLVDSRVLSAEVDFNPSVLDLLMLQRIIECNYVVESTGIRREIAHYKDRQRTGEDYVDVPVRSTKNRAIRASASPFNYTIAE